MQENKVESLPELFKSVQRNMVMADGAEQPNRIAYLRANERAQLEFTLLVMLENLASDFNVKDNFTADQVEDCYMTIISEFHIISPEEILYVFRRAKSGTYGPVYNRLDTATICGWIREYINGERLTYFQQSRQEKKESRDNEFNALAAYNKEKEHQQKHGKPLMIANAEDLKKRQLQERLREQVEDFKSKENERDENKNTELRLRDIWA